MQDNDLRDEEVVGSLDLQNIKLYKNYKIELILLTLFT
ncbi:hypothetical protein ACUXTG_001504 [Staphylococcus capitis]